MNRVIFIISLLGAASLQAQRAVADSATIDEVVITGQYGRNPVQKSLHKVEVINKEQIKRLAATNVAEVLNQTLNVLIVPEQNTANSKANILGLDANYTKILIDNIPVVGDTGLGSNIDLTKITLDNVERIEIVKGSMGVEFGNNAMAGVINIITKNSDKKKWNIRGFVQEESVGKEYDWIDYGKGKHVQSLGISHNIGSGFFVNATFNRTDFQGFWGAKKGKNYFESDNLRGYEWQPKEQINPSLLLRYSKGNTQLTYKADYLKEEINYYNPLVEALPPANTYTATDRDYHTERWLHHLALAANIGKARFNSDLSYQKQTRERQDKLFDIPNRQVLNTFPSETNFRSETWYSRSTLHNFLNAGSADIQIGYEGDYTRGFAGPGTARYQGDSVERKIATLGVFASGEFRLADNWLLRPGFRYNFSDVFKAKPNFSLVLKHSPNAHSDIRAIVGSSNRNPTFEELFTYFVDTNHDVRGNEELKPEASYSGSIFYSYNTQGNSGLRWNFEASTMYLAVRDRIALAVTNSIPLQYRFINIDTFESWLNTASLRLSGRNYGAFAGVSLIGKMQDVPGNADTSLRYTPELSLSAYYQFGNGPSISANYKASGTSYDVMEDNTLGVQQLFLIKRNGFSLLDASIAQKFRKNRFTLTLGVKNIFDVTTITSVGASEGAHNTGGISQPLFYGRSYFGNINFNF